MTLLQKTEVYVSSQLTQKLPHHFIYHNLAHTRRVVKAVEEIVAFETINEEDILLLKLAAWFHDIGYIKNRENHEQHGAEIAKQFLIKEKISEDKINTIINCILITAKNREPNNLLEKIILDADCSHLGNKNYFEASELLREEWIQSNICVFTDEDWLQENISFFTKNHQYYTDFAITNWQFIKDKNLVKLFKTVRENKEKKEAKTQKKQVLDLKKKKATTPERGIETMFRVTLKNHITLSDIADTKANILLSVNAIIISLALSNLIPKLDNPSNQHLIIPTIVFVIFSLASMALSVIATRPNVTGGKFTKKDVEQKKVNLLFFGNFHKMKLDDFEWAIKQVMKDRDYLYSSMTKDLYFLGQVLHKKYKILRITYAVFLIGIICSVIAFSVSFYMVN